MRIRLALAMVAGSLLMASLSNAQEIATRSYPARTEVHAVPSRTLSDSQFLRAETEGGTSVALGGILRIAQGSGRLPVVVLLHGSGGMASNIEYWTREFSEAGISTFAIDPFTARGLVNTNADQGQLGRLNIILDAYRALNVLAKHSRVDNSRIALMGFSRGGQATLYASLARFHKAWNNSGIEFAAYVPFYPDCMTTFQSDSETVNRPIRVYHGASDDYDPVAPCKAYIDRLKVAGRDAQLIEYPGVAHAFDSPLLSRTPTPIKGGQTVRNCMIREEPLGLLINAATKQPFTYGDSCVETGPKVGHDPVATQAAKQAVLEFLANLFRSKN